MKLFHHQQQFADNPPARVMLNWEMGTGKSMAVLAAIDGERLSGRRLKTLIVAPKSVLRSAWLRDAQNFPALKVVLVSGQNKKIRREQIYTPNADILVTNFEIFKIHKNDFASAYCGIWRLVIDESSKIKACRAMGRVSEIAKTAIEFSDRTQSVWLLSGTPAPNSEVEWYNQLRCLDMGLSGRDSFGFAHTWCYPNKRTIRVGKATKDIITGWNMRPDMREKFAEMLKKRVWTIRASECIDLPEETEIIHEVVMNAAEANAYVAAMNQLVIDLGGGEVSSINPISKTMKLRQITGGGVRVDGHAYKISKGLGSKMATLLELIEEIGGKAVVWAEFTHEIEEIRAQLEKKNIKVGVINGWASANERAEIIDNFQNTDLVQVVVAHAAAAGHGVTLTAARHNIFYSIGWVPENHEQSRKRIHRIGQRWPVEHHYLISPNTVDQKVLDVVKRKKSAAEAITELLKGEFHGTDREPEIEPETDGSTSECGGSAGWGEAYISP